MTTVNIGRRRTPMSRLGEAITSLSPRQRVVLIVAEVIVLLLLWQVLVGTFRVINPTFLPPPAEIAKGFGSLMSGGVLLPSLAVSVQSWMAGFGIAVAIGIPLALLMGASKPIDRVVSPIAWVLYAAPAVAYQPLAKAWFGFGNGPVIFLVAMFATFPILLNVSAGMRTTSPSLLRASRVYGASALERYLKVYLPSTVPYLFAGLRQAVVLATIGMIVAEMTGSSTGIGSVIIRSANTYRTGESFAAIALVVVWSVVLTLAVGLVERAVAPWNRGRR